MTGAPGSRSPGPWSSSVHVFLTRPVGSCTPFVLSSIYFHRCVFGRVESESGSLESFVSSRPSSQPPSRVRLQSFPSHSDHPAPRPTANMAPQACTLSSIIANLPRPPSKAQRAANRQNALNPIAVCRLLTLKQWCYFVVGVMAWVIDSLDFFAVSLTLKRLEGYFGKSAHTLTTSVTLTLLFRSLGAFLFGAISDRYGRRWPLTANLLIVAALELGSGFVQSFGAFLAVRSLFGIGMGKHLLPPSFKMALILILLSFAGGIWGMGQSTSAPKPHVLLTPPRPVEQLPRRRSRTRLPKRAVSFRASCRSATPPSRNSASPHELS